MALFADVIVLAFVLAALDLSHFALGTVAIVIDAFAFIVDVGAMYMSVVFLTVGLVTKSGIASKYNTVCT